MDKDSIKMLEGYKEYWCNYKCPMREELANKVSDDDIEVYIDDVEYKCECTCPKCGETFIEYGSVDGKNVCFDAYIDNQEVDSDLCEHCPINLFVEQLKYEV